MRHLLIDGNNVLHRAYWVSQLEDKDGNRISGTFNTMKMIPNLLRKFRPDSVIIAWDIGRCQQRLKVYPEYKGQRKRDEKILEQLEYNKKMARRIMDHLPVKQIGVQNVEADDIIGYLSEKLKGKKIIVSNDQDFIQLVNKDVELYMPKQKKLLTEKNVNEFCGFPVEHYILWKCMAGDSSDNIPGFVGIGPKRATNIIQTVTVKKKKLQITKEQQQILDRNKYLIAIAALLTKEQIKEIRKQYKQEQKKKPDYKEVKKWFQKLGFKSLLWNYEDWKYTFIKIKRPTKVS